MLIFGGFSSRNFTYFCQFVFFTCVTSSSARLLPSVSITGLGLSRASFQVRFVAGRFLRLPGQLHLGGAVPESESGVGGRKPRRDAGRRVLLGFCR